MKSFFSFYILHNRRRSMIQMHPSLHVKLMSEFVSSGNGDDFVSTPFGIFLFKVGSK